MKPTAAIGMLAPARRLPPPPVFTPPTGMGVLPVTRACELGVGVGFSDGDAVVFGVAVGVVFGVVFGVGVGVLAGGGVPVMDGLGDGDGD
jgi:hypothetical protein